MVSWYVTDFRFTVDLLVLCEGNPPVTGGFPSRGSMMFCCPEKTAEQIVEAPRLLETLRRSCDVTLIFTSSPQRDQTMEPADEGCPSLAPLVPRYCHYNWDEWRPFFQNGVETPYGSSGDTAWIVWNRKCAEKNEFVPVFVLSMMNAAVILSSSSVVSLFFVYLMYHRNMC